MYFGILNLGLPIDPLWGFLLSLSCGSGIKSGLGTTSLGSFANRFSCQVGG